MTHTAVKEEFESLIDLNAAVDQIGTGFTFTEGPIWHPVEHYLLFSDMPADVRRRWEARSGVRQVMHPSNKCNGMTYDVDLNLVVCEHATSTVVRERPDGRREVVASHFDGMELNSPNDLCVHSDGSIYFSDPWYGRMPVYGVERPRPLGFQGVYRVAPGGAPQLVVNRYTFDQPNGICFSPDERLLYVNDTVQANIRVFEVKADGSLGFGRTFASGLKSEREPGVPDGMKCDSSGNVWVTAPRGIWVFAPSGDLLGQVRIPELASNLHWGGDDWRTLFVTATHSVYAIKIKVGPRLEPFMRPRGVGVAAPRAELYRAPGPPERRHAPPAAGELRLDPARCALIIQDLQNDVVMDGGAFAASGSPGHCREQNTIENVRRLADACRRRGVMVIHVWFIVEPGASGVTLNAPLFKDLVEGNAMVRGTWGAAPVPGLERQAGDHVVEKMRMSAWEGTSLETILKSGQRDTVIVTGAWTNMSIEHTARTGADKGYVMIVPEDGCSTMNADWHNASINYALRNVATVARTDAVIAAIS